MKNMKIQVMKYVKQHPNARLREIGGGLGVWHIKLVPVVHELVDAGMLKVTTHNDPANMDSYLMYSVRQK